MRGFLIGMFVAAYVCGGRGLGAHHSQAMFEAGQITLKGTVTKFQYTSPHIAVFLTIEMDGKRVPFRLEGGSPHTLRALGWTPSVLRVGDTVSVTFSRAKDGSRVGLLRSLEKADGTALPGGSGGSGGGPDQCGA